MFTGDIVRSITQDLHDDVRCGKHSLPVGDTTLFHRADMVEAAWNIATPILDVWQSLPPRNFPNYPAGSMGPGEADQLIARDGRAWWWP